MYRERLSNRDGCPNAAIVQGAQTLDVKTEYIQLQHASGCVADTIGFYNRTHPYQALGMKTPAKAFALGD